MEASFIRTESARMTAHDVNITDAVMELTYYCQTETMESDADDVGDNVADGHAADDDAADGHADDGHAADDDAADDHAADDDDGSGDNADSTDNDTRASTASSDLSL